MKALVTQKQSKLEQATLLGLIDNCQQIPRDDRLILRQSFKENSNELILILQKHKRKTDYLVLQPELRKFIAKFKAKQQQNLTPNTHLMKSQNKENIDINKHKNSQITTSLTKIKQKSPSPFKSSRNLSEIMYGFKEKKINSRLNSFSGNIQKQKYENFNSTNSNSKQDNTKRDSNWHFQSKLNYQIDEHNIDHFYEEKQKNINYKEFTNNHSNFTLLSDQNYQNQIHTFTYNHFNQEQKNQQIYQCYDNQPQIKQENNFPNLITPQYQMNLTTNIPLDERSEAQSSRIRVECVQNPTSPFERFQHLEGIRNQFDSKLSELFTSPEFLKQCLNFTNEQDSLESYQTYRLGSPENQQKEIKQHFPNISLSDTNTSMNVTHNQLKNINEVECFNDAVMHGIDQQTNSKQFNQFNTFFAKKTEGIEQQLTQQSTIKSNKKDFDISDPENQLQYNIQFLCDLKNNNYHSNNNSNHQTSQQYAISQLHSSPEINQSSPTNYHYTYTYNININQQQSNLNINSPTFSNKFQLKLEKLPGEIHECVNYLFYQNNLFIAEDIFSAVFSEGNLFKVTKNFFNLKLQGFYNNLNIQVNEKYIHQLFTYLDSNKDDLLDIKELGSGLDKIMERKSENKIYRFMKIVEGEGNILRKNDLEEHLGKIDSIYQDPMTWIYMKQYILNQKDFTKKIRLVIAQAIGNCITQDFQEILTNQSVS